MTDGQVSLVRAVPAAAADVVPDDPGADARGRGRRVRLGLADGPSRRPGRAGTGHVRRLDARRRARGAHHHDPHRPPRHLRPVPAPRGARQDGRDRRRALRGPARARPRLGLGRARARDLRDRRRSTAQARGSDARDDRDPRPDVRGGALRPRRGPRTSCTARSVGPVHASCPARHCTSAAPARSSRCRWCATTRTGGTARPTRSTASTSSGRSRATPGCPCSTRSGSPSAPPNGTRRSPVAQRRFGSWGGLVAGTSDRGRRRARRRSRVRRRGLRHPAHGLRPARDRRPVHGRGRPGSALRGSAAAGHHRPRSGDRPAEIFGIR